MSNSLGCSAVQCNQAERVLIHIYIYLTHWVAAFCFVRNPVPNFFGGNLKQMPEFRRLAIKIQKRTTMQKKVENKNANKKFKKIPKVGTKRVMTKIKSVRSSERN